MTARPAKKKTATRTPRQPDRPERTDIRTIARLANVSIATVSRTINGVTTVDPKLSKRVWDVVEKLDFVPNTQARALVSGRSKILGLIISEITNPFFPELIQGFEDIAVDNGYEILVSSTNHDPQRMSHCIRRMLERKVEGVAIMTFGIEEPLLDQLAKRKVPMVFIDHGPDRAGISVLKIDYHHGIRQAVQHLAALGHRSIAFVSGPHHLHSAQSRLAAYNKSMQECGIQPLSEQIAEGDHTLEGGGAAMEKLLALNPLPTAVVCSNDLTAIGVLHKLYRTGLKVPDDISVIGFDDIHIAEVMMPPLTTVQMSRADIAKAAFEALRSHVEATDSKPAPREYKVPTQLIVRESTGFPRGTMTHLRKKT
ncbi:LacI family DNA-binding transcriptional regulator [Acidicapsa dinghuensis]|uniref:LacI family DNA-binding transcriptional regulator n=1 Tax=Acidicapsa dinghuensis TaxID=2218256 RepID=A0ABW1EHT8_9BACT|nr:LacI family DNA-binding transcriptional regulator [Acidicapsa dinghuensis]